jgi:hypothetical protein
MNNKYPQEINVSEDNKLENALRQKINIWANAIPHHPYRDLGDKISIKSIWYKPAYPIRLRSQYEERTKKKGHEPFTNQEIPPRKLYELSDFKSWDIALSKVDDFIDDTNDFYVNGSQHVADCHTCDAKGWITCVQCHGVGKVTCPTCTGSGEVKCHTCSGRGDNYCTSCGGKGHKDKQISRTKQVRVPEQISYDSDGDSYVSREAYYRDETYYETVKERCTNCRGTGRTKCTTCSGTGKLTCKRCKGQGKITCPKCSGSGRNTCPTCNGHQKLMHHFYIERKLEYSVKGTCIIHSDVYNKFPQYLNEYNEYESYNIFSNKEDVIQKDQLPDESGLNGFINEYIQEAENETTNSNCKIFQQVDVSRIDTWELTYTFNGKEYIMCFTGSEYQIIPGLSPIYEVAFSQWKKGVSLARSFMYARSARLLKKSLKIGVFEIKEQVEVALDVVKNKINQSYALGSVIAGLLMLFFGSFITYTYFSDVNYVFNYAAFINNPDNFLYAYHAWIQTGLFFILGLFVLNSSRRWAQLLSYRIPTAILRVACGFIITSISIGILMLVLGLLNATGITIAITFFAWLIFKLLKIILFVLGLLLGLIIFIAKAIWSLITWIF